MASTVPPRDWTEIHWPDIAKRRRRALDRGAAAGGDRTARPASAAGNRRPDRRGLSGAGARAVAGHASRHLSALQPVGISTEHIDFPGTLTLPTDVALKEWIAIGENVARCRNPQAGDGDQPWRQQRCDVAGGAGSARASRMLVVTTSWFRFGMPDGLFSEEETRHGIHGGAIETSIMLARYPQSVRKEAIADFRPTSIDMEKTFRWLSAHRPVPFAWQTQDLHRKRRGRRRHQSLRGEGRATARSRRARVLRIARRRGQIRSGIVSS